MRRSILLRCAVQEPGAPEAIRVPDEVALSLSGAISGGQSLIPDRRTNPRSELNSIHGILSPEPS